MTIELSMQTFLDRVNTTFRVSREGIDPVELMLVDVTDLSDPNRGLPQDVRQDPFQLKLSGPLEPVLPQSMYTFAAEDAGAVELFMVPVGPSQGIMQYNVVVN